MILSCSEKEHILAGKLSVIERRRLSITIELILNSKAMLFHEPLTGLDVISSALLSTNLEKYKPKTVCNLSSTIFTNQQYGTCSGTGQPILGTMNKNDWTFNLLEIHGLVYVKYISIIYIIYLLKYYQHCRLYQKICLKKIKKIGVLYKL